MNSAPSRTRTELPQVRARRRNASRHPPFGTRVPPSHPPDSLRRGEHLPRRQSLQETSLVRLRLTHDLIGGEADVAMWKGIPDEEVVGEVRIVVLAFLHIWKLDIGDR